MPLGIPPIGSTIKLSRNEEEIFVVVGYSQVKRFGSDAVPFAVLPEFWNEQAYTFLDQATEDNPFTETQRMALLRKIKQKKNILSEMDYLEARAMAFGAEDIKPSTATKDQLERFLKELENSAANM